MDNELKAVLIGLMISGIILIVGFYYNPEGAAPLIALWLFMATGWAIASLRGKSFKDGLNTTHKGISYLRGKNPNDTPYRESVEWVERQGEERAWPIIQELIDKFYNKEDD